MPSIMQETFSIAKYYNVKPAFHSMTCAFSSVIYCELLRTLGGALERGSQKWLWKQHKQQTTDRAQKEGNQCKSLEIK
jgi:hypothetical protein